MMNILARILSHGFAIAIVVILAVGYIYRGDLFPGMELPAFLYPGEPATTETETPTAGGDDETPPAMGTETAGIASEPAPEPLPADTGAEPAMQDTPPAATDTVVDAPPPEIPAEEPETTAMPEAAPPEAPAEEAVTTAATEAMPPEVTAGEPETTTMPEAVPPEVTAGEPETTAMPEAAPLETPTEEPEAPVAIATEEPAAIAEAVDTTVPDTAAGEELSPLTAAAPEEGPSAQQEVAAVAEMPAEDAQPVEDAQATGLDSGAESMAAAGSPAPASGPAGTDAAVVEPRPYQLLAAAREAYWMHNYDEAEKKYRDLIALEPDNPDGYGELGNMFFSQGNWEQAADAYFSAGKKLLLAGHIEQAELLVTVIRGLNGTQADELQSLVNAASGTNR